MRVVLCVFLLVAVFPCFAFGDPELTWNAEAKTLKVAIPEGEEGENMKEVEFQKKDGEVWKTVSGSRFANRRNEPEAEEEKTVSQTMDDDPIGPGEHRVIVTRIHWDDKDGNGKASGTEYRVQHPEDGGEQHRNRPGEMT